MIKLNERSHICQGLMRINNMTDSEVDDLIKFDLENNINFFDTADIYDNGNSERKLGNFIKNNPTLRNKMFIQTKCGIKESELGKKYDLSYEYIIDCCKQSLARLNLEQIDSFLLHRLDPLMDAQEVYKAYKYLKDNKMIRYLGVSNFTTNAINYLLDNKVEIITNQIQVGLGQTNILDEIIAFNNSDGIYSSTTDMLFYLKNKNIELQSWSPFQYKFFKGSIFKVPEMTNCMAKISELAKKYNTCNGSIVTSFLLTIYNKTYVIIGDVKKERILESKNGENVKLSREDFYSLYQSANNILY